jgi:hypothetical protein
MTAAVAVARGGWGSVWRFASRREAFVHPLVQYGDPIMDRPEDVLANYPTIEWARLCRLARVSAPAPDPSWSHVRGTQHRREWAQTVWEGLLRVAQDPPTDCAEVCRIVRQDRTHYHTGDSDMAKRQAAEKTAPASTAHEAAPPAEASVKNRGPRGVPIDAVIHLLEDKDGKKFGPHHNPKKPGSKTHERFAQYVDGMTIAQALELGITSADLVYDVGKSFISITGGTGPAAAPAPADEVSEAA